MPVLSFAALVTTVIGIVANRHHNAEENAQRGKRERNIAQMKNDIVIYRTALRECLSCRSPRTANRLNQFSKSTNATYLQARNDLAPEDVRDFDALLFELNAASGFAVNEVIPQTANTQTVWQDINRRNKKLRKEKSHDALPGVIGEVDPCVAELRGAQSQFKTAIQDCLATHTLEAAEAVDRASCAASSALLLGNSKLTHNQQFNLDELESVLEQEADVALTYVYPSSPESEAMRDRIGYRMQLEAMLLGNDGRGFEIFFDDRFRGEDDVTKIVSGKVVEKFGGGSAKLKK